MTAHGSGNSAHQNAGNFFANPMIFDSSHLRGQKKSQWLADLKFWLLQRRLLQIDILQIPFLFFVLFD